VTDRPVRKDRSRPAGPVAPSDVSAVEASDDGPLTLRLAVLLLWIQAACAGLLAIAEVVALVRHGTDRFDWAAWIIAGPLVAAVGLWGAGRLLVERRVAGRGLGVTLQLCAVPVVFFMVTGDNDLWVRVVGVVIGVSVVVCLGLITAPPSRRALFGS
jgi:hypothetical protein